MEVNQDAEKKLKVWPNQEGLSYNTVVCSKYHVKNSICEKSCPNRQYSIVPMRKKIRKLKQCIMDWSVASLQISNTGIKCLPNNWQNVWFPFCSLAKWLVSLLPIRLIQLVPFLQICKLIFFSCRLVNLLVSCLQSSKLICFYLQIKKNFLSFCCMLANWLICSCTIGWQTDSFLDKQTACFPSCRSANWLIYTFFK